LSCNWQHCITHCLAVGSTVSHMSAFCYHFAVSCCSAYPLEQELHSSHLVPDQGCTPDVPRFPTGSASGVIGLCWQCAAELSSRSPGHLRVTASPVSHRLLYRAA